MSLVERFHAAGVSAKLSTKEITAWQRSSMAWCELEKEELESQLSTEKFQSEQKIAELLRDIQDLEAANNQGGYTMTQFDRNHLEIQRIGCT